MLDSQSLLLVDPNTNCQLCLGLDATRINAQNLLHRGIQDLRNSAASACTGCQLLVNGVHKALAATGKPQHLDILQKGANDRRYSLYIDYDSTARCARDFRFILLDTDEVSALASVTFRCDNESWRCFPLSSTFGDTSSIESTEWAIGQVHHCQSHCVECRRPVGLLPTRVLDLGVPGEVNLNDDLQLREGGGERGQYACLSHRWCHVPLLRMLSADLEAWKRNIAFNSLPATFRDAVIFTRKVGLRYLWIDAMCITQNDHDDWERECSNMTDIFSFSTLTLAATSAKDDSQGLFRLIEPPSRFNVADSKGQMRGLMVYESKLTSLSRELTRAPLVGRAWAYQERLLSPRILHFCNGFLVFECMHQTVTEDGFVSNTGQPKIDHTRALTEFTQKSLAARWRHVVQVYSSLNLTFEPDRLPAIAGLAQQMAKYRKDDYISGLWTSSIIDDLAWRKPQRMNKRSTSPTWSWAKGDGGIYYDPSGPMTPQAHLVTHSSFDAQKDVGNLPGNTSSNRKSTAANSTSSNSSERLSTHSNKSFRNSSAYSNLSVRSSIMMRPTTSHRVSSFITPSMRTSGSGSDSPTMTTSITLSGRLGRMPVILGQSFPHMKPLRFTEFVRNTALPQPLLFPDTWLEADALNGSLYCLQLGYTNEAIFGLALKIRDQSSFERIGLVRAEFGNEIPREMQLHLIEHGCEETNVTIF